MAGTSPSCRWTGMRALTPIPSPPRCAMTRRWSASCTPTTRWARSRTSPQSRSVDALGVDLLTIAGHKFNATKGVGARLVAAVKSAQAYKLYALPGGPPRRPGMVRAEGGAAIDMEIWELPAREFSSFVAGIPGPLGFGTVALADGCKVHGFVCEAHADRCDRHYGLRRLAGLVRKKHLEKPHHAGALHRSHAPGTAACFRAPFAATRDPVVVIEKAADFFRATVWHGSCEIRSR